MPAINYGFAGWEDAISEAEKMAIEMTAATATGVENVSRQTQSEVQFEMPVDTGYAQARWGVPEYGGIWDVSDNGLTIEQGSSIEPYEYIEDLNEGSSKQAPAGFLDAAAARAEDRLELAVDVATSKVDGG